MTSTTFFLIFIPLLVIILLAVNLIFAPHNTYYKYFIFKILEYLGKVIYNLLTLYVVITCRNFIWGDDFLTDLSILFNNFDLNTLMLYKGKILYISCCTVFIREIFTEIYNILKNKDIFSFIYVKIIRILKSIKIFFNISFSNFKLKIGIKPELFTVKIKNILAKNSDTDSPSKSEDKEPNKGKGRALSVSDSEEESSAKKRKLDKGKSKAIDLPHSSSNDKDSLVDRILSMMTYLEESEKIKKRCIRRIDKINEIDIIKILLEQKEEEEKKISEVKTEINKLMEEGKKTSADFEEVVDNIRYERYKAFKDLNGTPSSTNSSRPASPSNHSVRTNDEFPIYNPADYESGSENRGESSSKKK